MSTASQPPQAPDPVMPTSGGETIEAQLETIESMAKGIEGERKKLKQLLGDTNRLQEGNTQELGQLATQLAETLQSINHLFELVDFIYRRENAKGEFTESPPQAPAPVMPTSGGETIEAQLETIESMAKGIDGEREKLRRVVELDGRLQERHTMELGQLATKLASLLQSINHLIEIVQYENSQISE